MEGPGSFQDADRMMEVCRSTGSRYLALWAFRAQACPLIRLFDVDVEPVLIQISADLVQPSPFNSAEEPVWHAHGQGALMMLMPL